MSQFTKDIVGLAAAYCILVLAIVGAWLLSDYLNQRTHKE